MSASPLVKAPPGRSESYVLACSLTLPSCSCGLHGHQRHLPRRHAGGRLTPHTARCCPLCKEFGQTRVTRQLNRRDTSVVSGVGSPLRRRPFRPAHFVGSGRGSMLDNISCGVVVRSFASEGRQRQGGRRSVQRPAASTACSTCGGHPRPSGMFKNIFLRCRHPDDPGNKEAAWPGGFANSAGVPDNDPVIVCD